MSLKTEIEKLKNQVKKDEPSELEWLIQSRMHREAPDLIPMPEGKRPENQMSKADEELLLSRMRKSREHQY